MAKNSFLLRLLYILISFSLIKPAVSEERYEYYPMLIRFDIVAKDCERYVFDNINSTKDALLQLNALYKKEEWANIHNFIKNNNLYTFDDSLSNCATAFDFSGGTNYFGEAHGDLMLILHITSNKDQYIVEVDISDYVSSAINNLNNISNSYRERN